MGSGERMAEGEDKDTPGEGGARGAPVSAGPCSLLTWPLGNLASLLTGVPHLPEGKHFRPPPAKPFGSPLDHLRTCLGSIRSFLLAYVAVFYIHGGANGDEYPAFGAAATLSWSWICPLLLRNMVAAWTICGFWDWLMYLSPLAPRFKPFKIYPKLPTLLQVRHDAFWTSMGMVCATILEAAYCWGVANNKIPAAATLAEAPLTHLVWILFMTHLREPHDYLRHRLLHPWRVNWLPGPDPGRFLYKHIHKLHHKSYNTTAFSGTSTSFHPIENTIFLSAGFLAVPFGVHPVIFFALMVDCGFAAWLGHGGFVFPGTGDYYHNIHHTHFDCNYGTQNIGLDWLFGTFAARESDVKGIWKGKKIGLEDNDTSVFGGHKQG